MFSGHSGTKLEINNRRISGKPPNIWKPNNTFLNYTWVKEEIKREIRKNCELNENEITTYENLLDATKLVVIRKFITQTKGEKRHSAWKRRNKTVFIHRQHNIL